MGRGVQAYYPCIVWDSPETVGSLTAKPEPEGVSSWRLLANCTSHNWLASYLFQGDLSSELLWLSHRVIS